MSASCDAPSLAIGRSDLLDVSADAARGVLSHTIDRATRASGGDDRREPRPIAQTDVLGRIDSLERLARATAAVEQPAEVAGERIGAGAAVMPLARLTLALRSSPGAERRSAPRYPYFLPCRIAFGAQEHATTTLDIGRKGTLVRRPPGCEVQTGARGTVWFSSIGSIEVRVTGVNDSSINLVLTRRLSSVAEAAMNGLILRLRSENDYQAGQARMLAATVVSAFLAGIARREVSLEALLDRDYQPVTGSAPAQFTTAALPYYDQVLPDILSRFFDPRSGMIYAVITDRNGYVPVHNEPSNQPQRPGDEAYNRVHARQRRIYDDAVTLRAARFAREVVIQTYQRDTTTGRDRIVKDIAAPIFIQGRRWGCAEIAYSLTGD